MERYEIQRLSERMPIDADWGKPQWQGVSVLDVACVLGERPAFLPRTQVRLLYDDENLYVIFRVQDRYVRAVARDAHDPVWEDSCVEFFFAPHPNARVLPYFNLEVNCGGTALMHCNHVPRQEVTVLEIPDVEKIEVAHSLPRIIDPEITAATLWTVELRLPVTMLETYMACRPPGPGVVWRANFQKCGDGTSNPHWLTWSPVTNRKLDFHQPQFFGTLVFG